MAFGTGHHATTQGCLRALDRLLNEGARPQSVADIGCGTAVLAMGAAKELEAEIYASDLDAVAVEVAEANLAVNGLAGRVTCLEAAGFDHPDLRAAAPFELVFANILKGPLLDLVGDMADSVKPGGWVILSGILNTQADEVSDAYTMRGFAPVSREEIGEWTTLVLQHRPENG